MSKDAIEKFLPLLPLTYGAKPGHAWIMTPGGGHLAKAVSESHTALLVEAVNALYAERDALRGTIAADDERLRNAAVRVWGGDRHGCDTAEWMADELLAARADLDALRAALKAIEWEGTSVDYVRNTHAECCPRCGNLRGEGHAADCALALALGAGAEKA